MILREVCDAYKLSGGLLKGTREYVLQLPQIFTIAFWNLHFSSSWCGSNLHLIAHELPEVVGGLFVAIIVVWNPVLLDLYDELGNRGRVNFRRI
jgi:hypothetical protein